MCCGPPFSQTHSVIRMGRSIHVTGGNGEAGGGQGARQRKRTQASGSAHTLEVGKERKKGGGQWHLEFWETGLLGS